MTFLKPEDNERPINEVIDIKMQPNVDSVPEILPNVDNISETLPNVDSVPETLPNVDSNISPETVDKSKHILVDSLVFKLESSPDTDKDYRESKRQLAILKFLNKNNDKLKKYILIRKIKINSSQNINVVKELLEKSKLNELDKVDITELVPYTELTIDKSKNEYSVILNNEKKIIIEGPIDYMNLSTLPSRNVTSDITYEEDSNEEEESNDEEDSNEEDDSSSKIYIQVCLYKEKPKGLFAGKKKSKKAKKTKRKLQKTKTSKNEN
jgi:hypothetical protein